MEKKLSDLPIICISKENLILLKDLYSEDEIGKIMLAIIDYVLFGTEPSLPKGLNAGFKQLMYVVERKGEEYFKKVDRGTANLRDYNKKRKEQKSEKTSECTQSDIEEIEEQKERYKKIKEQKEKEKKAKYGQEFDI